MRRMASTECDHCREWIGYVTPFVSTDMRTIADSREVLIHAHCMDAWILAERALGDA